MNPPKIQIFFWDRGTGWQVGKAHSAFPLLLLHYFGFYWRGSWGLCVSQRVNVWLLLHELLYILWEQKYSHSMCTVSFNLPNTTAATTAAFGIFTSALLFSEASHWRRPLKGFPSVGHTLGMWSHTHHNDAITAVQRHTITLQVCFGRCKPSHVFCACATAWQRISQSLSWNHVLDCVNMS